MSRIGNLPVAVPDNVKVTLRDQSIQISGPLGPLEQTFDSRLRVTFLEDKRQLRVERADDDRETKALHGLTRNLIVNMIVGVTQGYSKSLQVVGVGYSAKVQGDELVLQLGYINPVHVRVPDGVKVDPPETGNLLILGVGSVPCVTVRIRSTDKQKVGHFAASVRRLRPPEPYKGKGIRFVGEEIRRKAGKAFATQE
jgi:large subunit ribosomal protein L6